MAPSVITRLLLLATVNCADYSTSAPSSDGPRQRGSVALEEHNFNTVVKRSGLLLVAVISPQCGHCRAFAPVFEEVAKHYHQRPHSWLGVRVARVDALNFNRLMERLPGPKIAGFPTVMLLREGKYVTTFSGKRTPAALKAFVAMYTNGMFGSVCSVWRSCFPPPPPLPPHSPPPTLLWLWLEQLKAQQEAAAKDSPMLLLLANLAAALLLIMALRWLIWLATPEKRQAPKPGPSPPTRPQLG